ncbi:acyl-CoA N-acyltransferase [Blastocladiella britannica]|nr:acyl-CoA N-acyltransferase [Blastocladiella britannica]
MLARLQQSQAGAPQPEKEHAFWKTQPVLQTLAEQKKVSEDGPLEPNRAPSEIRQAPYKLPEGYEWVEIDVLDEGEMDEVCKFLLDNYVEDADGTFRFGYPKEVLEWALKPPGWKKFWHIGVRITSSRRLVAFISGIPAHLTVNASVLPIVEINFLCVLKRLRSIRMAPVLIKEITRRCNLEGIFQAMYTAGTDLPGAISRCRYWHRPLQVEKLLDVGFSYLGKDETVSGRVEKLALKKVLIPLPGLRPMTAEDVPAVTSGLNAYLRNFQVAPVFSEEEVAHWFVPRDRVVYSLVVENDEGIESFVSFYRIPSSVLNHDKYTELNAAYSFYYFYPVDQTDPVANQKRLETLMYGALTVAKETGHDVFNALELMENPGILSGLNFSKGDGVLNYYLYNWRCKPVDGTQMASVLM